MSLEKQIRDYISGHPVQKRDDLEALHQLILRLNPACKLWFLDGKDESGKTISNPNIGYGAYTIKYADGKTRQFYQLGLSANTGGISVYIMGLPDKKQLINAYAEKIGKASVTGYCIKFKSLRDIRMDVLEAAIKDGFKPHA